MDFPWRDAQVDGVVGQATGVAFTDVAQLQAREGWRDWHDRLDWLGVVPVDKAISWPLSQEPERAVCVDVCCRAFRY
jgi:hypothetical protein